MRNFKQLSEQIYHSQKKSYEVAATVVINRDNFEVLDGKTLVVEILFHYMSGFPGFREVDAIISFLRELNIIFDVLMVNGHDIMHPRMFDLASHVGLLMNMSPIGIAKRLIGRNYKHRKNNSLKIIEFMNKTAEAYDKHIYIIIWHKIF